MPHTYVNVLTTAAVLAGGVEPLALRLKVAPKDLIAWIGNKATPPAEVMTKANAMIDAFEIDRTGTRLWGLANGHQAKNPKDNKKPATEGGP